MLTFAEEVSGEEDSEEEEGEEEEEEEEEEEDTGVGAIILPSFVAISLGLIVAHF